MSLSERLLLLRGSKQATLTRQDIGQLRLLELSGSLANHARQKHGGTPDPECGTCDFILKAISRSQTSR